MPLNLNYYLAHGTDLVAWMVGVLTEDCIFWAVVCIQEANSEESGIRITNIIYIFSLVNSSDGFQQVLYQSLPMPIRSKLKISNDCPWMLNYSLSEFSDENMMDPYNLAICFGPTLLPIPEDKDQVLYQNLVNELIKNIIIYQEEIFLTDGGMVYEKYISTNAPDETLVEFIILRERIKFEYFVSCFQFHASSVLEISWQNKSENVSHFS